MKNSIFILVCATVLFSACSTLKKTTVNPDNHDYLLSSVSWYQHSAEMHALYYQGFNIAQLRLDEAIKNNKQSKPLAVVVDIDETMMDNSLYETDVIKYGDNNDGWTNYTNHASAKALPGALEFALYSQSKDVEIFYITNRDDNERESTLRNLKNEGFPFATSDHLLTRSDTAYSTGNTSSKSGRRTKVSNTHEIVLLIGDNLNDFSEVFENRKTNDGKTAVAENKALFGKRFIVLPNPMYGAWEKPLLDFESKLSGKQKTEKLRNKLKSE